MSSRTLLLVAVSVAVLLRVAWAVRHGLAIDQDGAEYARIAQNLLAGRGYVGIFNNGVQLNYAPLYPLLIAGVSLVLRNTELAARAISIVFGAALVIPMFKIGERLYGRRVAGAVTALVVFHPALIALAASTYAEGPYLTLLMSGVLWVLIWVTDRRIRSGAMTGAFLGLAYLTRPEAFVFLGAIAGGALFATLFARQRRATVLGTFALTVTFAAVASPYVVFLTRSTGRFRIEGKGTIVYRWGQEMDSGMTYQQAGYRISDDLTDQGTFLKPNLEVVTSTSYTTRDYLAYLQKTARRNLGEIWRTIVGEQVLGSPLLFALVVIGLFRNGWDRRRATLEGVLLATAGTAVLILFSVQLLFFRFFFPLLGPLLIWGGKGVDDLRDWGRATATSFFRSERVVRAAGGFVKWASIGLVLALSLRELPDLDLFRDSLLQERKQAGQWLGAQQPGRKWIMDSGTQVTYYAGGDLIYLPYAAPDLALRYVAKRNPSFIVLHGVGSATSPQTAHWFDTGIPDRRAVLVYDEGRPPHDRIKIYRWVGAAAPAP